ncbi:MAG: signal peptidase I [Sphingobacteriales bacterium]|nr:MAG: signal peptidase I [Sphingobacteriales bacterium]
MHVFIPFLQDVTWLEILGKNKRKAIWGLIPYVNYLFALTWVTDTLHCFGKKSFLHHAFASFFGFISFIYIGFFDKDAKYLGPLFANNNKIKRSTVREWSDAIVFAVIAATFVRMFTLEAYKIPTTSMEGSLLAGDFLFVSKFNYGARIPQTPLGIPFFHHSLPNNLGKAYSKLIQLPYKRLPGFEDIKRGDIVVFNYPGDAIENPDRPVDKRENYVKRCVAISGDTLQIIDRQLYIDHKKQPHYKEMQMMYDVILNKKLDRAALDKFGMLWFYDVAGFNFADGFGNPVEPLDAMHNIMDNYLANNDTITLLLTNNQISQLKENGYIKNIISHPNLESAAWIEDIFVAPAIFKWTVDNFGPIVVPYKGMSIELTTENFAKYYSTIKYFEKKTIERNNNNQIIIDGNIATTFTFSQNYFFMMGDNRHNSLDSRYWGFVPEDHVVGKPLFVWFSMNNFEEFPKNIKWNRIFKSVTSLCK